MTISNLIENSDINQKILQLLKKSNPFGNKLKIQSFHKKNILSIIEKSNLNFSNFTFIFKKHKLNDNAVFIASSNPNSPYLNKQQKLFIDEIYTKALSAYSNSQELGTIPLNITRFLSSPSIIFFLGINVNYKQFLKNHFDFIINTFPDLNKQQTDHIIVDIEKSFQSTPPQINKTEIHRLSQILELAIFNKVPSTKITTTTSFSNFNPFEVDENNDIFNDILTTKTQEILNKSNASLIETSSNLLLNNFKQISPKNTPKEVKLSQQKSSIETTNLISTQSILKTTDLSHTIQALSNQLKNMSQQIEAIDFTNVNSTKTTTDTSMRPDWLW
ncbi:MAG: hypothetical protein COB02_01525 [Candidatus Cloacimonadota bacterium]|nr:MAG: hypothetical protein COB02_01525 [Candidatus Cloacimonadota bacterium]